MAETPETPETPTDRPTPEDRRASHRVLQVTCIQCGGARGFTNLAVSKRGREITFDVHAVGACVVVLEEAAWRELHELIGEWFG